MSHLSTERLAALADETPTAEELTHLELCEACSREVAGYRALAALADAERSRIGVPLSSWDAIAAGLASPVAVGPVDDGAPEDVAPRQRRIAGRRWGIVGLRAAAAILLVAGGVAGGRWSAGVEPVPGLALGGRSAPAAEAARDAGSTTTTPTVADADAGRATPAARPAADSAARASTTPVASGDSVIGFRSVAEARAARRHYETLYQAAAAYLAQHDSSGLAPDSPAAMRQRLAALDRVGETMRAAMRRTPYDPVINGYYLSALGEREATLRQLNTSLPEGVRINSF